MRSRSTRSTDRSVSRRVQKAVARPAIPAPTIATSAVVSASSGRAGPSGSSWAIHGDRLGRSGYVVAPSAGGAAARASDGATLTGRSGSGGGHPVEDRALDTLEGDALLRHRVAVADRRGPVLERIDIDGHAPRRADLVLAPIQLADRGRVVIDRHDVLLEIGEEPVAQLDDLG